MRILDERWLSRRGGNFHLPINELTHFSTTYWFPGHGAKRTEDCLLPKRESPSDLGLSWMCTLYPPFSNLSAGNDSHSTCLIYSRDRTPDSTCQLSIKPSCHEPGELVQSYKKTVKHLGVLEERFEKHCTITTTVRVKCTNQELTA
jgi:hypothetical protein